ncbi:YihA family ribosome biogenesis GTP-binding protein [Helicobacter sp. MIT 05-5293]|uniref:ribosome biogenesis GTP-binding protein YihA/YsxC n=1 Tax=Helicobacter sp. MIT 05-5293 TaxID=1548149 RepID=UPI00051D30AB|nr:ribosome biogenesis GTP-binding protein YihA/YsxC [Helicobacter sp. MIT 05-5293]TLD79804.1 YihA family ribosome biogenesis GTP-binding protein [Helicobacter sp. MIT 05-5293]
MNTQESDNPIIIKKASFIKSANDFHNAPAPHYSEIVFLGRSNVGKSTLINTILNENLAKSSSTPGKTQLINFFETLWEIQGQIVPLIFVDLPGFGYAKVSKDTKKHWEKNLLQFLLKRDCIKLFLHLVDARHQDLAIDQQVEGFLQEICRNDQQILRIYTKCDKLNQSQIHKIAQSASSTQSLCVSATNSNHRKLTSIKQLRGVILQKVLGYS